MSGETIPQLLYTVTDAAAMLSISRAHLYRLMSSNKIKYLKMGRSTRFSHKNLTDYVDKLVKKANARQKRNEFVVK